MDALLWDVKYCLRQFRRLPLFVGAVVATLALAIGSNTLLFAIANAAIFRALPYPDSGRLVQIHGSSASSGSVAGVSAPDFAELREQSRSFEGLGAYVETGFNLSRAGEPERVARQLVADGFTANIDYARQMLAEVPYGVWRDYDPEDTMRFYALRLHEAGLIRSTPNKLIAEGADWRFLNELKRELKT